MGRSSGLDLLDDSPRPARPVVDGTPTAPPLPPSKGGRPALPVKTFAVQVMLTNHQSSVVDRWVVDMNNTARADGAGGPKIKRNHFFQTIIDAMEEAGYDAGQLVGLDAFKADLVKRLRRKG